jgi:hypothetical protein
MGQLNLIDENDKPLATVPQAPALNLVDENDKPLAGNTPAVSVKLDYGNGNTDQTDWLGPAVTFGKHFLSSANPVPVDLLKSIYERGNLETAKSILGAQGAQFEKAKEAFHKGDYLNASRYTLGWLLPLIGPAANEAGDALGRGEYAKGLGQAAGLAAQPLVSAGLGKVLSAGKIAVESKLNPVQQGAVNFADQQGIPLDLATRTGNGAAQTLQNVMAKQLGGAGIAADARGAQTAALQKTAENLRTQVEPNLGTNEYTAETAGQGVKDAIQSRADRFGKKAGDAYDQLRQIEADPQNAKIIATAEGPKAVPLAADMRGVKQALQPIYDEMKQRLPIAQQQANPGLKAVENILQGEDFVPASVAEGNLGALKSIARDSALPQARRLAMNAIDQLDGEVKAAVNQAGPDAIQALERGRALTRAKYSALDVLDTLKNEPVKVFDQLTARRDTQLNLLRDVQRQAPQEMPKLGRAFLEGLFDQATQEGGFGKAGTIANKWEALGTESKNLMFQNPGLIQDLDNFFRIARRISENPNPSGTASTLASVTTAGVVVTNPVTGLSYILGSNLLARALFNPRAAQAINEGLRLPISAPGAGKAAYLLKLAGEQGQQVQQPQPAY